MSRRSRCYWHRRWASPAAGGCLERKREKGGKSLDESGCEEVVGGICEALGGWAVGEIWVRGRGNGGEGLEGKELVREGRGNGLGMVVELQGVEVRQCAEKRIGGDGR